MITQATPTTALYPLSLHDALPISRAARARAQVGEDAAAREGAAQGRIRRGCRSAATRGTRAATRARGAQGEAPDRKSTRLNSSHLGISYAVFCLKKKTEATVSELK